MNDDAANGLTPAEEDPELHRVLAALPTPDPVVGMEERVLSRVWRPAPPIARRLRAIPRGLIDSGRIWLIVGSLGFGSLMLLAAALVVFRIFAAQVGGAVGGVAAHAAPWAVAAASAAAASLVGTLRFYVAQLGLSEQTWAAIGGGSVIVLLLCALGLRRAMTPSRTRQ